MDVPTKVDDRGRVLIPQELRTRSGIKPGQDVRVEIEDEGNLVIQPVLSSDEFLEDATGAINEDTRRAEAEPIDPLELKQMWKPSP